MRRNISYTKSYTIPVVPGAPPGPAVPGAPERPVSRPVCAARPAHPACPARLGLAFLLCAVPAAAAAQHGGPPRPAAAPAPALDAALRRDVVDTLAAELERVYVDADTGRLIARRLRERLAAGAYERLTDAQGFADALREDLQAVNGDLH